MEILGWLGGYSAVLAGILYGLFKWKGDVWAKRIAQREQHELSERLKKLESRNIPKTHVHRIQFEREYLAYVDIWKRLTRHSDQLMKCGSRIQEDELTELGIALAQEKCDEIRLMQKKQDELFRYIIGLQPFVSGKTHKASCDTLEVMMAVLIGMMEKMSNFNPAISLESCEPPFIDIDLTFSFDEVTSHLLIVSKSIKQRCAEMIVIE